ncbi:hypothetical protein ACA910_015563 [Epithemia clementina (nom. ined.)]
MEKSPDGASVISVAADETLRFWNVFLTPRKSSLLLSTAGASSSSSSPSVSSSKSGHNDDDADTQLARRTKQERAGR